jgi:hypothetical protein
VSKDLYYTIPRFFEARMAAHNKVARCQLLDDVDYIKYGIERTGDLPNLTVFLSDAYTFTEAELFEMMRVVSKGDYILVARPEAGFTTSVGKEARSYKIGLGRIGTFMGALNVRNVWEYLTPEQREEMKARRRS